MLRQSAQQRITKTVFTNPSFALLFLVIPLQRPRPLGRWLLVVFRSFWLQISVNCHFQTFWTTLSLPSGCMGTICCWTITSAPAMTRTTMTYVQRLSRVYTIGCRVWSLAVSMNNFESMFALPGIFSTTTGLDLAAHTGWPWSACTKTK